MVKLLKLELLVEMQAKALEAGKTYIVTTKLMVHEDDYDGTKWSAIDQVAKKMFGDTSAVYR